MVDILHRVGIRAPADAVFNAVTTSEGLRGWWTDETELDEDIIHFRFGERGFFDMKVLDSEPEQHLRWQVMDGPAEWIGTKVNWDLRQEEDHTIVLFKHEGWKEPVEFMHHCSTKWGTFLMSLKALVETGKGAPYPNDVKTDDWG